MNRLLGLALVMALLDIMPGARSAQTLAAPYLAGASQPASFGAARLSNPGANSSGGVAAIWSEHGGSVVGISAGGLQPLSHIVVRLRAGTCSHQGQVLFALANLITDSQGRATALTTIRAAVVPASGWSLAVAAHDGSRLLCGEVHRTNLLGRLTGAGADHGLLLFASPVDLGVLDHGTPWALAEIVLYVQGMPAYGTYAEGLRAGTCAHPGFNLDSLTMMQADGRGRAVVSAYLRLSEVANLATDRLSVTLTNSAGTVMVCGTLMSESPQAWAQSSALAQLNGFRRLEGLPAVRLNAALNRSALALAHYWDINTNTDQSYHLEVAGRPGFTGVFSTNRALTAGYAAPMSEEYSRNLDPVGVIAYLLSAPYHRPALLAYNTQDLGYAVALDAAPRPLSVVDLGAGVPRVPGHRLLVAFPPDGQQGVPPDWYNSEVPDPLPGKPLPVGYPISVTVVAPGAGASGSGHLLRGEVTTTAGHQVTTYVLDATDPNLRSWPNTFYLIPRHPLALHTTYVVRMSGIDSQGQPFSAHWSFTTAPNPAGFWPVFSSPIRGTAGS